MMPTIKLPERDVERRAVLGMMLHLSKKETNKFTVQEIEEICLRRGLLEVVVE